MNNKKNTVFSSNELRMSKYFVFKVQIFVCAVLTASVLCDLFRFEEGILYELGIAGCEACKTKC